MKRAVLIFTILLSVISAIGQMMMRNMVVLEIGTGTWCTYCPGSANAADQLVSEGKSVAVIENHNGDPFTNAASNARNSYYGITGYPTARFDGILYYVGGQACPNGNVYSSYLPIYEQRINTPAYLTLCMSGSAAGNNYTVNVMVKKLGTITATSLRLHLVLTESEIATAPWPPSGGCMTDVNFVERLMVPDYNGTSFNFSSGDIQNFTLNFTKDPTWNAAHCELVAFVQDNATKEIFNGIKSALNSLPSTMMTLTDFTGNPTSGCSPLTVNFTSVSTGVTSYNWIFTGGNPLYSTAANPAVTYNSAGSFNVGLKVSNSVCKDTLGKTAYITVNSTPLAPGIPSGNNWMCANPPNQVYTTSGSTGATSYEWDLTPPSSGVMTPAGTQCTIDWENTFTGVAQLKVRASNVCGTGAWSPSQSITISADPGQCPAPTGTTQLCQDPPNTTYTTTGVPVSTSYSWQLLPLTAGTIYPSGTSCTVDWDPLFTGTADLRVKAINNSCEGALSNPLLITVSPLPQSYNITGGGVYCAHGGTGVPVGLDGSQTGVNYTLYLNGNPTGSTVPGTGAPISFGNQMTAGNYTAQGNNPATTCSAGMAGTAVVSVDPEPPLTPSDPTGPEHVYTGATPSSDYTTTGGTYATTYSWDLSPSNSGTIVGTGTTGTVTWDLTYAGTAFVKVQGVNSCGGGTFSNEFEVTVDIGVGMAERNPNSSWAIYPNPAKGVVTLISENPIQVDIVIRNVQGICVKTFRSLNIQKLITLDISSLPPGIYFINLHSTGLNENLKLMIQ